MEKVYFVGAGPGDPGLITVKGMEILRQAEVIIYDYLVDKRLLDELPPEIELVCTDQLGKKRYSKMNSDSQEKINRLIIKKAAEGRKVVRLKCGDTSIFSRLSQELQALNKRRIEYEVVPGVTAASAASCYAGVPLTDREYASSVVFVTGKEALSKSKSPVDWKSISGCGTIVLYMAVENIAWIAEKLISAGRSKNTPVLAVSDAACITQKTAAGSLGSIAGIVKEKGIKPPSVFIIGESVRLSRKYDWQKRNKKILFSGLSPKRYFLKGTYCHLPFIKIAPLEDYKDYDSCILKINDYDWIIFTSRYCVEYFFKRLSAVGYDSRSLSGIKIAAIGGSTKKKLAGYGINSDLTARKESSLGLLEEFRSIDIKNKKVFITRSDISDKGLPEEFAKMGALVTQSVAYRNIMPENLPDLDLEQFDEIMFTSPSGVRNFVKRYGRIPKKAVIKCIGDVTRKQAEKSGFKVYA